jgi:transcriptional regulator of acetoin/glycerol metabolism
MKRQLKKEVLLSWERCIEKAVPEQLSSPRFIHQQKTEGLTADNNVLISIFERMVRNVNHFITTNHLFLLSDRDGNLLFVTGTKMILQMIKTSGIEIGMSFSEESIGTNAIALAMKLKQSVYFFPEQHYCSLFKKWYCYAVPLYIGGEIKAYLDISTVEHDMKREFIAITQLMVEKIVYEYIATCSPKIDGEIKFNARQLAILKLLSQGLTAEAIALETGISVNTVKYHKKMLFRKLDAQSIGEAISKAVMAGLIRE